VRLPRFGATTVRLVALIFAFQIFTGLRAGLPLREQITTKYGAVPQSALNESLQRSESKAHHANGEEATAWIQPFSKAVFFASS